MILLTRVDNRLIHGQVIEAWLPFLGVKRVVVADDEAAHNALMKAAMGLAVPADVEVRIEPLDKVDYHGIATDPVRTLVLLRDVVGAVQARERGLPTGTLNLGNVHMGAGRRTITRAVHLSNDEVDQLRNLSRGGMTISFQAVPAEKPLGADALK